MTKTFNTLWNKLVNTLKCMHVLFSIINFFNRNLSTNVSLYINDIPHTKEECYEFIWYRKLK